MASAWWSAWWWWRCSGSWRPWRFPAPVPCNGAWNWTVACAGCGWGSTVAGWPRERDRQPCALQLTATGWQPPLTGDLPACRGGVTALAETGAGGLELHSNLPDAVRFNSNGLVLDGGMVVLSHPSHGQGLCLVIGLPLGISRSGVYRGDPSGSLSSALCLPSDA